MWPSAVDRRRETQHAFTLVELILLIVVGGILFATTPRLVSQGVRTMVWLPRALAVNQVAGELEHQIIEGGFSTLTGQTTIRGLRFAVKTGTQSALWFVRPDRIGFLNADGQYVVVRLDGTQIKRGLMLSASCASFPVPSTEELMPYDVATVVTNGVQITTGALFLYYDSAGILVAPLANGCLPATTIRRVDIAFTAQTGNGVFDQGQAQESVTSSVAIRVP